MANKIVREIIHAKGIDIGIYTKDFENEYSECESCHSKEKTNSLFYAQSKGYIKKT